MLLYLPQLCAVDVQNIGSVWARGFFSDLSTQAAGLEDLMRCLLVLTTNSIDYCNHRLSLNYLDQIIIAAADLTLLCVTNLLIEQQSEIPGLRKMLSYLIWFLKLGITKSKRSLQVSSSTQATRLNLKHNAGEEQMFSMFTLQRPRSLRLQRRWLINHGLLEET